jgi:hypothetical protein
MDSSALNVVLSNVDVVSKNPCIMGMMSCVSKDTRLMVATSHAEKRYNCQLALAVVRGRISLGRPCTDRRAVACAIMDLSCTIGSFVKCKTLLAGVQGAFSMDDVESIESSYFSKKTRYPLAVAAQAEEIRLFLSDP